MVQSLVPHTKPRKTLFVHRGTLRYFDFCHLRPSPIPIIAHQVPEGSLAAVRQGHIEGILSGIDTGLAFLPTSSPRA